MIGLALCLALVGCRSVVPVPPAPSDGPAPGDASVSIEQRIVVLVHGDASYLYHDPDGTAHQADVETLREAFAAARAMPRAEVFVFHQRPARRFLGLIPRDDGTVYHFRRGRLLHKDTYDQDRHTPFSVEARLMREHGTAVDASAFTAALYYGHAIPERRRRGYHRSRPDVPFSVDALARGLGRMAPDGRPLDALVLSTCDGGTPPTISAVAPYARHILAAPGDLHLSFVDADLLPTLPPDPPVWTSRLAEQAFDRLTARTVTGVSLATYHTDRAGPIARRLAEVAIPDTSTSPTGAPHADCRRILDRPVDTAGVNVWYRPPKFGRHAGVETHSGWGCVQPSQGER